MGSVTSFSGVIEISPPMPWGMFGRLFQAWEKDAESDVKIVMNSHTQWDELGSRTVYTAVAIAPAGEDAFKGYHMDEWIQEVVDLDPTRTYTGHIEGRHESGAVHRLKVVDGRVRRFEPVLVWPEGSE